MKIVALSDTHGHHEGIKMPYGDVLIFAGDFTGTDYSPIALRRFLRWFSLFPHRHKIWIAGNHDMVLEREPTVSKSILSDFYDIHYLQDEPITINGLKFYGSPVTPSFCNWSFNRDRGAQIQKHWDLIPSDTDVLITHGPAYGLKDLTDTNEHVGCKDLLAALERVQPRYHLFGHIHNGYGYTTLNNERDEIVTRCYNCSIVSEDYQVAHMPHVFTYVPPPATTQTVPTS